LSRARRPTPSWAEIPPRLLHDPDLVSLEGFEADQIEDTCGFGVGERPGLPVDEDGHHVGHVPAPQAGVGRRERGFGFAQRDGAPVRVVEQKTRTSLALVGRGEAPALRDGSKALGFGSFGSVQGHELDGARTRVESQDAPLTSARERYHPGPRTWPG